MLYKGVKGPVTITDSGKKTKITVVRLLHLPPYLTHIYLY